MPALVALPAAYSGKTMTPESSEGRERIARMEVQIDANRRQIETLAPLALQVGLVQRGQEELRDDMKELRQDMDARFDRQERSMSNQFAACSSEIARVAKALEARDERIVTDKTSRRAMWGLVTAAAVTGLLGLVAQIITALT